MSILLAHAGLLAWAAAVHSPNNQEVAAMGAGVRTWATGRFDLLHVNPPLVRVLATLPVFVSGVNCDWSRLRTDPTLRSEYDVGVDFVRANRDNALWLFFIARVTCIPLSIFGAICCYAWATRLYGMHGGLVALSTWCFNPVLLGHAETIATDVAGAAFTVVASYAAWRWITRPSYSRAGIAGLLLGMAWLTKLTLLVLLPLWAAFALARHRGHWKSLGFHLCVGLAIITSIALLVVNQGYCYEGSFQPLGSYGFVSNMLSGADSDRVVTSVENNRFANTWLAGLPIPLPSSFVHGIDIQRRDFENGKWCYLNGEWKLGGWSYYYLFVLLLKTPVTTLFIAAIAAMNMAKNDERRRIRSEELFVLATSATLFLFVSSQTGISQHPRYIFPALALAAVWVGRAVRIRLPFPQAITLVAILCTLIECLSCYPHSTAFFNVLVGGPTQGHMYLLHSNIDTGQDVILLRRWQKEHTEASPIFLAISGCVDPEVFGVEGDDVFKDSSLHQRNDMRHGPRVEQTSGWLAISVNCLHARDSPFSFLKETEPVARVGYTILLYQVTPEEWRRVNEDGLLRP